MSPRDIYKQARAHALKQQLMFYDGTPCKNCKGTKRYTSNADCFVCITERNRSKKFAQPLYSREGPPQYEQRYRPVLLKPWPHMRFEDTETTDRAGSYVEKPYIALLSASSAADTAEG